MRLIRAIEGEGGSGGEWRIVNLEFNLLEELFVKFLKILVVVLN